MPYINVDGMRVHVKLSGQRQPQPRCVAWEGPKGQLTRCEQFSTHQCDWKLTDNSTCDAPICAKHAHRFGHDLHHCPIHHKRDAELRRRGLFTSLGIDS